MAIYGLDFYGLSNTRYGARAFLQYSAEPVLANSRGRYGELRVSWTSPAGMWSRLRLVRNSYGVPVDEDDGVLLLDVLSGPAAGGARQPEVRAFTDTGLDPGRFQYYAVWVFDPAAGEWVRAGQTTGLPLKNFGYGQRLWELTPSVHRTTSSDLLATDNEELRLFLQLFGTQLDHLRGEYETLLAVNDPQQVAGNLLPLMAQQYGQVYEPELGMRQMRTLLSATVRLYRTKGTETGIESAIQALSGYTARLRPLKNLLLDYNDSSAEESIGSWTGGYLNSTLEQRLADDVIDAPPALGLMRRKGVFRQVSTGSGSVRVRTSGDVLRAVPVTPGTTYCLSGYARGAAAAGPSATLGVLWTDAAGTPLTPSGPGNNTFSSGVHLNGAGRLVASAEGGVVLTSTLATAPLIGRGVLSVLGVVQPAAGVPLLAAGRLRIGGSGTYPSMGIFPGSSTTPGTSSLGPLNTAPRNIWAMAERRGVVLRGAPSATFAVTDAAWTRGWLVEPAPPRAAFAALSMGFTATAAGQAMYWDALMLEAGTSPSTFEDARLLDLDLLAPRVNLVPNPSAESGTAGNVGTNLVVSQSTSWSSSGTSSFALTPNSTDPDSHMNVAGDAGGLRLGMQPGQTYTASATVNTPVALTGILGATRAQRIVVFHRIGAGAYVEVASPRGPTTGAGRVSVVFTLPTGTTEAFVRLYNGATNSAANVVQWDAILVERGAELRPYFDGSSSIRSDTLWQNTPHASPSHLYPQRQTKNARMAELLPQYVPHGSSFRLNYALAQGGYTASYTATYQ